MDKSLIMLVVIFLLLGVIAGLTIGNRVSQTQMPTGKVAYEGLQPEVIEIGEMDARNLNRIIIPEDNVVCYVKAGQGAGISCLTLTEEMQEEIE